MSADQFALDAWSKSEAHLAEGAVLRAEATPLAIVHAAYYAMFHAARAVLLRATGSSPKKHASVVGQFGRLAKDRSTEVRRAGDDLNTVEALRIDADYEEKALIAAEEAREALRKAENFLDLCAKEFGFARAQSSDNG